MNKSLALANATTVWEAKQESLRTAVSQHALRLFVERGYEATRVDDIARLAGIGRRTFFRYFETKNDVVLWRFDQFARHAVELLRARPAREPALTALERALTEACEFYNHDPVQTLSILKLTEETRSLLAQQLLQQERWRGWFADALRARGSYADTSLQAEITAAIGLETMALAVRRWVETPALGLSEHVGCCFAALRKITALHG